MYAILTIRVYFDFKAIKKVSENHCFLNIVLLQLRQWQLYLLFFDPLFNSISKNSSNIQSGAPSSYPQDSHFISINTSSSINASILHLYIRLSGDFFFWWGILFYRCICFCIVYYFLHLIQKDHKFICKS